MAYAKSGRSSGGKAGTNRKTGSNSGSVIQGGLGSSSSGGKMMKSSKKESEIQEALHLAAA